MAEPPVSPRSKKNQQNLLDQDIESMGFIQLKARCGMEGLSTFGTKKQLLGRLRQHLQKQGNSVNSNNNGNSNANGTTKNKLKTDHNVMTKPNGAKHKKKNYSTQVNSYQNSQPKKNITNNNNNNNNGNKFNNNMNNKMNNNGNNTINKPKRNSNNNSPVKSNKNANTSWNAYNPDEDPELQDVDPDKDDFFKPIATGNDSDDGQPERRPMGSVIYNRGPEPKKLIPSILENTIWYILIFDIYIDIDINTEPLQILLEH